MLRHLSLHFRYRIYFCVFEPPLDPDRRIFHADRGYETLTLIRKISYVFLRKLIFYQRKFISLLQMKYILFVGKILQGTKMRQAIWNKNQTRLSQQELVLHSSLEKGAQWFAESNTIRVKIFGPTPALWVKKSYPLLFSKYDIQYT